MNNSPPKDFSFISPVSPCWKLPLRERVQFILSMKGKTHTWLADEIGINKGTLSKILNGFWLPTAKIKILLSKSLGVDSLILFGDNQFFLEYRKTIQSNTRSLK